jgi:hypothetical protein
MPFLLPIFPELCIQVLPCSCLAVFLYLPRFADFLFLSYASLLLVHACICTTLVHGSLVVIRRYGILLCCRIIISVDIGTIICYGCMRAARPAHTPWRILAHVLYFFALPAVPLIAVATRARLRRRPFGALVPANVVEHFPSTARWCICLARQRQGLAAPRALRPATRVCHHNLPAFFCALHATAYLEDVRAFLLAQPVCRSLRMPSQHVTAETDELRVYRIRR